jgi:hypothetical protein
MLLSHNLTGIVHFPTRITGSSATAIDNIFFNITRFEDYSVYPIKNDLSDDDGQIVKIKIELPTFNGGINMIRKVNEYTIIDFLNKLSNESWECTFNTENVDLMFNSFLNTYLRIFYSSFPPIRINSRKNNKIWITQGIRKSCKHKRALFLLTKNSNNPSLNWHYKMYCNILTKVINEEKKMYYNKRITNSTNKTKTTWKIINELLGKHNSSQDIHKLTLEDKHFTNHNDIVNLLNQ